MLIHHGVGLVEKVLEVGMLGNVLTDLLLALLDKSLCLGSDLEFCLNGLEFRGCTL